MSDALHNAWTHGGADALGAARFDFSTNSNACGPCPAALAAVQATDATHYPDPTYTALRQSLAGFHGVAPERVLLAGSASEAIFRLTAWAHQQGVRTVHLPAHHYGDYARAAQAWGMRRVVAGCDGFGRADVGALTDAGQSAAGAELHWACEPSSPLGQAHGGWPSWLTHHGLSGAKPPATHASVVEQRVDQSVSTQSLLVLDRAYAPLRLSGASSLDDAQLDQVWQLFTPNKALGLTGVRAAYVIAPGSLSSGAVGQTRLDLASINLMAPSWPVGAHGVAMLQAWVTPEVQGWLADSLQTLRHWKSGQIELLTSAGWQVAPSEANYFCVRPPHPLDLAALRTHHGIKLRDATSFGLPGWYRLGVLGPQAQDALAAALQDKHTGAYAPSITSEAST